MKFNLKTFAPTLIALMVVASPHFVWTWGTNGHRIVAEVAQRNLTGKASKAIEEVLEGESLAQVATWPDYVRSEPPWDFLKNWHFLTVEDDQDLKDVLKESGKNGKPDNVVEAILFFEGILKGDQDKIKSFREMMNANKVSPKISLKATALTFLVHFVGDVHQPLHVGRGGDRGGNYIGVNWFGKSSNLHSVWDSGLIDNEQLSFSEYAQFINQAGAEQIKNWQKSSPEAWAAESIGLRSAIYQFDSPKAKFFSKANVGDLSYQYAHDKIPIVNDRLLKGGIRLAGRLNAIFK